MILDAGSGDSKGQERSRSLLSIYSGGIDRNIGNVSAFE
jgi:hypothetical protein